MTGAIHKASMQCIRTVCIITLSMAIATPILAQPKPTKPQAPAAAKPAAATTQSAADETKPSALIDAPADPAPERYEIFTSYSQGKKLIGYTDGRYVGNDKTNYLKSDALTANIEFAIKIPYRIRGGRSDSTLQDIFHGTDYLRFGGQLSGWSILNGSSISAPKVGSIAASSATLPAQTRPGMGFFFGFGKKDFELDIGFNMSLAFENEGSRTKYVFVNGVQQLDASGNPITEQESGRGLFISNAFVWPTFKMFWGARDSLQYFITAGRETFEVQRDYIQTFFRLPLGAIVRLDIGAGVYPNATFFLQPNFLIGPIMLGLRGGISLNYYSDDLKRVAVTDAIYLSGSLSARF